MKYKTFLLETSGKKPVLDEPSYKNTISEEEAIKLIKTHCKNVNIKKPLYRGMKRKYGEDFYSIQADKGSRKSQNTSNHYTLIIDHFLNSKYGNRVPFRGKSLICTNDLSYTYNYGDAFVIFPYDDTEIGKCPHFDIWHTRIALGDIRGTIDDINNYLNDVVSDPKSYSDIVNAITKFLNDDSNDGAKGWAGQIYAAFKDTWEEWGDDEEWDEVDKKDVVEGVLEQAYDPEHSLEFEFGTYKELEIDELDTEHEFWFGGKCVAIEITEFKMMIRNGKFE